MSKKALKAYLQSLEKEDLEEQIIDLYERWGEVRVFYNFVFNPREKELMEKAKIKISKEYFPSTQKKAKARPSIAQKLIKHFIKLGVDPYLVADLMLYNVEIAQGYSKEKKKPKETFFKSMYKSSEFALKYLLSQGVFKDFRERMLKITNFLILEDWSNSERFKQLQTQIDSSAKNL